MQFQKQKPRGEPQGKGTSALPEGGPEFCQQQEQASAVDSALRLQTGAGLPKPCLVV